MPQINQPVEDFSFEATRGISAKLSDYRGKWVVLYFYPKDNTPGCTQECREFQLFSQKLNSSHYVIFGVSKDSLSSHEKFREKLNLSFDLMSDPEAKLCNYFEVIQDKTLYGKLFKGIERSTFLIDPEGLLRFEWRKVQVKNHAEIVLECLEKLF